MRARHVAHALASFPVYSAAFLSPYELVLGGGGGTTKSGIKNKLRLYAMDETLNLKLVDETELGSGEDAPMSMAAHPEERKVVCGVNSAVDKVQKGENQNCRFYNIERMRLKFDTMRGTLSMKDEEDYQRVTAFSPDGRYLAVAGTQELTVFTFPELKPTSIRLDKGEIYDVSFSDSLLVVTTKLNLLVYSLPSSPSPPSSNSEKGKSKETSTSSDADPAPYTLLLTIASPKLPGAGPDAIASFRASAFHPLEPRVFYTVLNATLPRKKGVKTAPKRAYIVKWHVNADGWKADRVRKVGDKGVASFDISPNGKWIAFGSSDCSVGVLDSWTLVPLLTILKAHELPSTMLRFNPSSSLLVSGSADSTVRVVSIPNGLGDSSWPTVLIVIMGVFAVLFAIVLQMYIAGVL
ncbi:WD40 repeat-like protein [Stereum hirsutum FP-91666 SS1]|uniref:WD40 repeat-like protein n=1 Tax=Stereum hirsutum (strain FP-91666) TaxID=721885 RepID=UPI000440E990|nr:WD40 repeat-like protein [Stereum hirsutum FP-91666 SS1]EIM88128.1 WD40 repeat-like protein [Stereum hirsutum FP-91666 SS1]